MTVPRMITKVERHPRRSPRLRVQPSMTSCVLLQVFLLVGSVCGAPRPLPDSDSPSSDSNSVQGMLVITPGTIPRAIFIADDTDNDDVINYYIPVVMAETAAPVSTRDPSIIVVRGCRGGYDKDPSGACRKIFSFPSWTTTPRPRPRPFVRSPRPRPRVVPQTQRDLVRRFNNSRRRNTWFGRSLNGSGENTSTSSSSSASLSSTSSSAASLVPIAYGFPAPITPPTPTSTTIQTTTQDQDD